MNNWKSFGSLASEKKRSLSLGLPVPPNYSSLSVTLSVLKVTIIEFLLIILLVGKKDVRIKEMIVKQILLIVSKEIYEEV